MILYNNYPFIKSFYKQVDIFWKLNFGYSITDLIFQRNDELSIKQLNDTKNTHPAMFVSNMAMYKLLKESGLKADYMIGHSLGEISALFAGGMVDLKSALKITGFRGLSFDKIPEKFRGKMLSVNLNKKDLEDLIGDNDINVSISNINSKLQTVIGGMEEEIEKLKIVLSENKINYKF